MPIRHHLFDGERVRTGLRGTHLESENGCRLPRRAIHVVDELAQVRTRSRNVLRFLPHHCALYIGAGSVRGALEEQSPSPNEQKIVENVTKRVRMWKDVEPFYPDQTTGLPKTSESRGTESILDSLILVWNDVPSGKLSADARLALDNMWALQLKTGDMRGAWAWLQFHNAPWEGDSQYYGNTLAAIVIGSAPGDYKSEPAIQPGLKMLREYLQKGMDAQTPLIASCCSGRRQDHGPTHGSPAEDHHRPDPGEAAGRRRLQHVFPGGRVEAER